MGGEPIFGCPRCGGLADQQVRATKCPTCGASELVVLDGRTDAPQQQALLAWGRRETTLVVEDQIFLIAFFVGGVGAAAVGIMLGLEGMAVLVTAIWSAVALALAASLQAERLFRWRFPTSTMRLLPNPRDRRARAWGLAAWLLAPVLAMVLLKVQAQRTDLGSYLKALVSNLWSQLTH